MRVIMCRPSDRPLSPHDAACAATTEDRPAAASRPEAADARAAHRFSVPGVAGLVRRMRSAGASAGPRRVPGLLRLAPCLMALSLAACGSNPVPTFDLSAPAGFSARGGGGGQLVVVTPTALSALDTERILVEPAPGQITYLPDAQWSDRLPSLLQARAIQAFENGSRLRRVSRPGDGVAADYQLNLDIRTFGVQVTAGQPEAVVILSAKVIALASGKIIAAQVFSGRVPVAAMNGANVTAALDSASNKVLTDIVLWSGRF